MGLPMIDQGPVLLRIADSIAHLTLNRPDVSNGMNVELLNALCDAIMVCHGEPDIRAILLTGEGKNFHTSVGFPTDRLGGLRLARAKR